MPITIYDSNINIRTVKTKKLQFKHHCENHNSNMSNVINDFIDFCIANNVKPDEISNLQLIKN